MGIPLVGKRHQRKASTSQTTDRKFGAVPNRVRSASGSGCSSADHQQSFQPQESSSDNREHFVGALLSRRVAAKGDVHARRIQFLCKELDTPAVGNCAAGRNKDRRGGALATSSGSGGWDQGQDQMRVVGPVFVIRASETWSDEIRISRPVARVLDGALGTRRGELGALRWSDCNFDGMSFSVQHSYYWRRGGHLKATKTEASAKVLPMHLSLKDALLEWKSQTEYKGPGDFVFPSLRCKGKKPLDLAAVLKKKIQPAFASVGILGVGWHTFRHTVGTM